MPGMISPTIWQLIRRTLISLLATSLVLLVAFLLTAWGNGVWHPSNFFRQPAQVDAPTSLVINVFPEDSVITLNDKPYNPRDILVPGDYLLKVSHSNYQSIEEKIRIHPNVQNQLLVRLIPLVSIQEISNYAVFPGWDNQNDLYYFNFSDGKIYNGINNTTLDTQISNLGAIHQFIFLMNGTQAVAVISDGPESSSKLYLANFQSGEISELPVTGLISDKQDNEIWGIDNLREDSENILWKLTPGEEPLFYPLETQDWAIDVKRLLVSSSEEWLAIESPRGIAVWELASGERLATFENASAPVWVNDPQPGLAYINRDRSLNFARADHNWNSIVLQENIQTPIAVMPGSSEIVFARFNPFQGGTSFWAVDTATTGVRLLAAARTESGRAEQILVSPDGKRIAFVNHKNILFIVTLEP